MSSCSPINHYVIGSQVRMLGAFVNSLGVAADPTTIVLSVRQPDGTVLTFHYPSPPDIQRDGTGSYHYDFVPTQTGSHTYRWDGEGAVIAVDEKQFVVNPSIVLS